MKDLRWNIPRGPVTIPEALVGAGFPPLLAALLQKRGLDEPEAARAFLDPDASALSDPYLLTDMDRAAARLRRAIVARERVAVYGDYDVDGITSSCMLTDYLRSRGLPCVLYIPDRMEEGYGVNREAIDALRAEGVSLIVTVDCGVTTVEETAYAAEQGVEMLITDHHECREVLPPATAVVDPKRPDCAYPGAELAGVGVAFKLLCALEGDSESVLRRYADLVAIGTVADVMPLTGENRYIVRRGLEKFETDPRPGLRALVEQSRLGDRKLTAGSIGYSISPRLNASGRLGRTGIATELLLTDDPAVAERKAAELCELNRERQALELGIWQEATEQLRGGTDGAPIVLAHEGWHQGVIGIAASRLTEAYNVPAVMISLEGEHGKGSCRSCGGFNLFDALSDCGALLEGFGGHALAAGLTIRRERIAEFRAALAAYWRSHPAQGEPSLDLDLCVDDPALLSMESVEALGRLEPCGTGNARPTLCLCGARLTELTPIGGGRHTRARLEKFGQSYECVFFSRQVSQLPVRPGDWVDAAFFPQINTFRGRSSVQLLLSELRPHDETLGRGLLRAPVSPADAVDCPGREDFVAVWKALCARGGQVRGNLASLTEQLAPTQREERVALALRVFEEVGLLRLTEQKRELVIQCVSGKRANLHDSPTLRALEGAVVS